MKAIFDTVSARCSRITTKAYSTSFSLGIYFLSKELRSPIYNIYGFVRFADEIVDSFHGYDKQKLLTDFKNDTKKAISEKISLNPILNSFQAVVHKYNIEWDLIETFLKSMEMDLDLHSCDQQSYEEYILGSAEVVGLMCLKVFVSGDEEEYQRLKPSAMKLGSAFQKVNFLRDMKADYEGLGRSYFPGINLQRFDESDKKLIEKDIRADFSEALQGIKKLPKGARPGVYLAYVYYYHLFIKIIKTPSADILSARIRIPNFNKFVLMFVSMVRYRFNLL